MKKPKVCLFDGQVLVENLAELSDLVCSENEKGNLQNTSTTFAGDTAAREETRKAADDVLDIVEIAVTKVVKDQSDDERRFAKLTRDIPGDSLHVWNTFLDNVVDILRRLRLAKELYSYVEEISLIIQGMKLVSKRAVALREDFDRISRKLKGYWSLDSNDPGVTEMGRRFSVVSCINEFLQLTSEAADTVLFAHKTKSPMILEETRSYLKRLANLRIAKATSGVLSELQSFHRGIDAYSVMCLGVELENFSTESKSEQLIGKGFFGKVFVTKFAGVYAAKKLIAPKAKVSVFTAFVQELWIWRELSVNYPSPYIVRLFGAGVDSKTRQFGYIAELAYLRSLRFALNTSRLQGLSFVKRVALDVSQGLKHMHSHDLAHLDLKPANVLLFREGGRMVAKLCDFGISQRISRDGQIGPACFKGSGAYMAPEARRWGYVATSNDIFALGLVLYEMIEPCFDELRQSNVNCLCSTTLRFERRYISTAVRELILDCTQYEHTGRPNINVVVQRLEKIKMYKSLRERLSAGVFQTCKPSKSNSERLGKQVSSACRCTHETKVGHSHSATHAVLSASTKLKATQPQHTKPISERVQSEPAVSKTTGKSKKQKTPSRETTHKPIEQTRRGERTSINTKGEDRASSQINGGAASERCPPVSEVKPTKPMVERDTKERVIPSATITKDSNFAGNGDSASRMTLSLLLSVPAAMVKHAFGPCSSRLLGGGLFSEGLKPVVVAESLPASNVPMISQQRTENSKEPPWNDRNLGPREDI